MANEPTYLVQSKDGVLHGYWNRLVLRSDLIFNRDEPPIAIFKLSRHAKLVVRYKRLISRV